jgi:hypothetical protein
MVGISLVLAVGGTLVFSGLNCGVAAGDHTPAATGAEIMLAKAYLVFTKESWGCLEGQTIVADVTNDLIAPDGKPVQLTEVKNPEDVDNRLELYLYYRASEIRGDGGYYVLRLGVTGPDARVPGVLRLARAALQSGSQSTSFQLKAKTTGQLKADLLYAGDSQLGAGLFTCEAADIFEPHPVSFLGAYPIRTELSSSAAKIDSNWDKVDIQLDDFLLREADALAVCYELVSAMQKKFSASNEYLFLWDQRQLTPEGLNQLASSFEKNRNCRFHVKIELRTPRGSTEIQKDPTPFDPHLRQMLAVRNAQGEITGGSVWIAVESPSAK